MVDFLAICFLPFRTKGENLATVLPNRRKHSQNISLVWVQYGCQEIQIQTILSLILPPKIVQKSSFSIKTQVFYLRHSFLQIQIQLEKICTVTNYLVKRFLELEKTKKNAQKWKTMKLVQIYLSLLNKTTITTNFFAFFFVFSSNFFNAWRSMQIQIHSPIITTETLISEGQNQNGLLHKLDIRTGNWRHLANDAWPRKWCKGPACPCEFQMWMERKKVV